ncbi:MAG: hypothetical protein IT555_16815 [Acetobacteraceae bacterium]|nr:hypothetical protein [Acetobacteraceae bacterium]
MTQDASSYRKVDPEHAFRPLDGEDDGHAPPAVDADFADALLAALTEMAALSPRRQADVAVAMRRAGLTAGAEARVAALEQLSRDGCIEQPVQLSDGGILVAVTMRGIEHLATTAHRHVARSLMVPGPA